MPAELTRAAARLLTAADGTADVASAADRLGSWLVGTGLRIAVIVLVGVATLVTLRVLIRSVTQHIAEGAPGIGEVPQPGEGAGALLGRLGPLASARRAQRARTIGSVLRSTSTLVIGTLVVLLVLDALGQNIAPFIASAGIVGVALGFGAQSLVKDFLSGMFMLLEDQYGVGDVVDVGPAVGTVESVGLRVTKIRDATGTLWYVPNGTMTRVGNKTQGFAKAVVEVKVDYFASLDEVRAILRAAAAQVVADPVVGTYVHDEPTITGIEDLTADAITLRVSLRTAPAMQWDVARELRIAVRAGLAAAGVPLGGQRDLMTADRAARDVEPVDRPAPEDVTTHESAAG